MSISGPKLVMSVLILSGLVIPGVAGQDEEPWTIESEEPMPEFRLGPLNQGYFTGQVPMNNTTLWTTEFDSAILSSPIVVDGRLYVGTMGGDLVCLSSNTGNLIWKFSTGDAIESSPAYHDGSVYIGSDNGRVYKLNAENGKLIWWNQTGAAIKSSPKVMDARVLVGSNDFGMHCFAIENGEELWNFSTGGYVFSSAAISEGYAYFGSCDGNVYSVNITNGSEMWRFHAEYIPASPLVRNNEVMLGTYDERFYWIGKNTGMENMNLSGFVSGVYSSAAIYSGMLVRGPPFYPEQMLFVADNNGTMYGIGVSGDVFWTQPHDHGITSSPVLVQQERNPSDVFLIYGVQDGTFHMRDIRNPYITRDLRYVPPIEWSIKLGTSIQSSPFIYHGKVYIGVETRSGGKVVCIGEIWPQHEVVIGIDSNAFQEDPAQGRVVISGTYDGVEPDHLRVQFRGEGGAADGISQFPDPGHWRTSFQTFGEYGPTTVRAWAWKDDRLLADEVFHVVVLGGGVSDIEITIDRPTPGEKVEGVVLASGTAASEFQLLEVSVRVGDDGAWYLADGLENWTVALETFNLSDGKHTLWVRVTDEYRSADASVTVRVGTDPKVDDVGITLLEVITLVVLVVILLFLFRTKPPRVSERASGQ